MTGSLFILVSNLSFAALVAGIFFILARVDGAPPVTGRFGASYLAGTLTPAGNLVAYLWPATAEVATGVAFCAFLLALLMMAAALARYYGVPVPRRLVAGGGAAVLLLWGVAALGPWSLPLRAYLSQFALAAGAGLCALMVFRGRRGRLDQVLAGLFCLAALLFLTRPVVASLFGTDLPGRDAPGGLPVQIFQSLNGRMFILVALVLMLVVVLDTVAIIQRTADHDGLSGLFNRRAFDREAMARLGTVPAVALMFDIDRFKDINDRHGHATGDRIIQCVAGMLRAHMPADAVLGRMGGEEFAVLLSAVAPVEAVRMAEAFRAAVAAGTRADIGISCTISGGLAVEQRGEGLSVLMARADRALYAAKEGGRNCVLEDGAEAASAASGRGARPA